MLEGAHVAREAVSRPAKTANSNVKGAIASERVWTGCSRGAVHVAFVRHKGVIDGKCLDPGDPTTPNATLTNCGGLGCNH